MSLSNNRNLRARQRASEYVVLVNWMRFVGIVAALLCVTFSAMANDAQREASSSADRISAALVTQLVAVDEQRVQVNVTNAGQWPLEIETRDTPFDHVHAHSMLVVERSSASWSPRARLEYIGRVAKRVAPGPDERLVLTPGETASAMVDVAANYRIADATQEALTSDADSTNADSVHRVSLAHFWNVRELNDDAVRLRSKGGAGTAAAKVAPQASILMSLTPNINKLLRARAPSFDGCSVDARADITAAAEVAERIAVDAVDSLASVTGEQRSTSPRYNTWFGVYDAARYSRVQSNFNGIASALADETVNYVCGCTDAGVFAYVFPSRPYDVYLCPAFWSAEIDGTDSRAGTIVHELSHFTVVAGTDDHRYTQAGTQDLARTSPELAVDNADSHEYFAENTPFIEMTGSGAPADGPPDVSADGTDLLRGGQFLESSLALGDTLVIRVSGAVRVRLDTLRGDADLVVWRDAARTERICSSAYIPPVSDHCDLDGSEVWVDVYGYADSDFRLVALADTTDVVASLPVAGSLVDGDQVRGELQVNEYLAYVVNDGVQLDLIVESGGVSLHVFQGYATTQDRLVCENSASGDQGEDSLSCTVLTDGPHTAVVTGAASTQFLLRVSGGSTVAPEIPVEDGTPYVGGTGSGGNAGDVPSDDDPGFGFGNDSGCSIGGNTAKGAGGAVPLAGLFLAMLVLRSLGRRRFAGLRYARGATRCHLPGLAMPALLGVAALSVACTHVTDKAANKVEGIAGGGSGSTGASQAAVDAGAVLAEVSDTRLEVGMELEEALPVTVTVWVSNPGETEVDFLLWNTPFETTLSADVFEVVSGEARLPYEGRMIKRGVPPASAWISLSPGQRHEVQVDLGSVYDFSSAGVYVVRLAPTSQGDVQRFNPSAVVEVVTPPVQIEVVKLQE